MIYIKFDNHSTLFREYRTIIAVSGRNKAVSMTASEMRSEAFTNEKKSISRYACVIDAKSGNG